MSGEKVTVEERIEAAKECAEGRMSQSEAARRLGLNRETVRGWVAGYKAHGALAFRNRERNTIYPEDMKETAVREYLLGSGSLNEIASKYGLRSKAQLLSWIKVYNSGKVL